MNKPEQKIVKQITLQWEEIIRLVSQIEFGEVILKIQNKEVVLTEYRVTRKKGDETEKMEVFPL